MLRTGYEQVSIGRRPKIGIEKTGLKPVFPIDASYYRTDGYKLLQSVSNCSLTVFVAGKSGNNKSVNVRFYQAPGGDEMKSDNNNKTKQIKGKKTKMKIKGIMVRALLAIAGAALLSSIAKASTPSFYSPGDLVLYFQQENSNNTLYVDLGNTANVFRGAATGPDVSSMLNMININSDLTNAFGSSWASLTNLYMGTAGFQGTNGTTNLLVNGDPSRTLYVGQSRDAVGNAGTANSTGYTVPGNTFMTQGATGIQGMNQPFLAAGTGTAMIVESGPGPGIKDANPFLAPGIQDTAFDIFAGGVQQVGTAGLFASTFGPVSNVEFALDLYRIEAKNNIPGQVGFGEPLRVGTYEGSLALDSLGNVSFVGAAVPEPSTNALLGAAALVFGFVVVRRRKMA